MALWVQAAPEVAADVDVVPAVEVDVDVDTVDDVEAAVVEVVEPADELDGLLEQPAKHAAATRAEVPSPTSFPLRFIGASRAPILRTLARKYPHRGVSGPACEAIRPPGRAGHESVPRRCAIEVVGIGVSRTMPWMKRRTRRKTSRLSSAHGMSI